jgi:hypothetical protein
MIRCRLVNSHGIFGWVFILVFRVFQEIVFRTHWERTDWQVCSCKRCYNSVEIVVTLSILTGCLSHTASRRRPLDFTLELLATPVPPLSLTLIKNHSLSCLFSLLCSVTRTTLISHCLTLLHFNLLAISLQFVVHSLHLFNRRTPNIITTVFIWWVSN